MEDTMSTNTAQDNGTVTFEVTLAEIATALTVTAHLDPDLYRAVRRAIPAEHFPAVAVLASTDGLEALDAKAGYTGHHDQ